MSISMITTGTELLKGTVLNTNQAFLGRELEQIGMRLASTLTVGDHPREIYAGLAALLPVSECIVVTGGLGPTDDDITLDAVCRYLGVELETDPVLVDKVTAFWHRSHRGRVPRQVLRQARAPRGAHRIENPEGSASGWRIDTTFLGAPRRIYLLPGPPRELEPMFRNEAMPMLRKKIGSSIVSFMVRTFGQGEGDAALKLGKLCAQSNPTVATYLGAHGEVFVRVTAKGETQAQAKAMACPTWADVFDRVEQGSAAYGVLPFENSHAGDVSAVLDLCYAHRLHIVEMYDLPVTQNLLALPGAALGDLRRVTSHPQALSQCERFIRSVGLAAEPCANTALAARRVAESGDKTLAAIASAETAELYGLQVLMRDINTDGDNTTRFIVVGKELPARGNRFSLLFTVDHKAGALARVIQAIAAAGFNMECIKSRPMPHVPFEYYFYVELVGAADAPDARQLLTGLETVCRTVRVLGIYTRKGETV